MAQNMQQANIGQLAAWQASGGQGDLPVGWSGGGGNSSNSTSTGNTDYASVAQQMTDLYTKANAPAVASLQAGIPETQAKYGQIKTQIEAEKAPLEQRYQNLLDEGRLA